MHRLPKIVLERLKRKTIGNQLNRQSTIGNRQSPHPDANLLAAFVEKTLTQRERTQLLNHLAQCGECRELVALTLPAKVDVAQSEYLPARRGWSAWPTLRWGVLAVTLGAAVIVVVLHPYPSRRPERASKDMRPITVTGASKAPRRSPAELSAQSSAKAAVAQVGAKSRESPREMAKLEKGAAPTAGQQIAAQPAGAETKQRVTLMAAARPPGGAQVENIPTVSRAPEIPRRETAISVGATPSAPPPAQLVLKPSAALEGTPKAVAGAESEAGATAVPVAAESVAVSKDLKAALVGGISPPSSTVSAPRAAPMRAKTRAGGPARMAFRGEAGSAVAQPAALWTISAGGKVQRSDDGGRTWEEVRIDDRITFRVIHAMGRDVWAGGSEGALYHSRDGGAIWTRANLSSGGSSTTETIVVIIPSSRNLQHITVRTVSGEQWTTEDGGQHWQKEP